MNRNIQKPLKRLALSGAALALTAAVAIPAVSAATRESSESRTAALEGARFQNTTIAAEAYALLDYWIDEGEFDEESHATAELVFAIDCAAAIIDDAIAHAEKHVAGADQAELDFDHLMPKECDPVLPESLAYAEVDLDFSGAAHDDDEGHDDDDDEDHDDAEAEAEAEADDDDDDAEVDDDDDDDDDAEVDDDDDDDDDAEADDDDDGDETEGAEDGDETEVDDDTEIDEGAALEADVEDDEDLDEVIVEPAEEVVEEPAVD